jgi:hypothetical protein
MAPDDISVDNPASETAGKPKMDVNAPRRSIGPESEDRGGPEAPHDTLDATRPLPVRGRRAAVAPAKRMTATYVRGDQPHAYAGAVLASDPPKPPGVPPEVPDPDQPTPIEEPPHPIPVPADEPPPPMVAASQT